MTEIKKGIVYMLKKKLQKGEWGYLEQSKKYTIVYTIVMFVVALSIFVLGYVLTGTKENIASIIAVLVLLPASRAMVSMIMHIKTPKYSHDVYETVASCAGNVPVLYQLYLTSYKKNFPLNCVAVKGNNLMCYTEFGNCDIKACEEHVDMLLKQNRNKNVNIKIFTELKKFEERLGQLQTLDAVSQDEEVLQLMKNISL